MSGNVLKITGGVLCLQLVAFNNLYAGLSDQGSSFTLAPSVSQFSYSEPGYMEDTGVMYGLTASYSWRGENLGPIEMIKAEATALWGGVDYSSFGAGSIHGIPDSIIETRFLFGTNLFRQGQTVFTPYVGLGYRRLTDKSEGLVSTTGAFGYDRQSNYYYSPIGIEISSNLETGLTVGGILEYDFFVDGTQVTSVPRDMLTNGAAVSGNFTNDQNHGYGLRASLKILKNISNACRLVFEPYYRYWNIKVSKPDSIVKTETGNLQKIITVVEPGNNSSEYGIKVGVEF